jgi:hypothetical protein
LILVEHERPQAASSSNILHRLFQIARVEAFGEPAVNRSEKIAGLLPFALIVPEPGEWTRQHATPVLLGLSWLDPARASSVSEDLPYSMFQPIYDKIVTSMHDFFARF